MNRARAAITVALIALAGARWAFADAPALPSGFFVEDLSRHPPAPAFYNLETHALQPFPLRRAYRQFIDFAWDKERRTVFFSARATPTEPYRIYRKVWPDGEEQAVYENPLGPFRFLLSPDGKRFALQIMGPSAWPTVAVYDWQDQTVKALGTGYSPDWSLDGQRLLFLEIPGALPSWLYEYRVDADTGTRILNQPVMEAAYTDDSDQIILKTAVESKRCDVFQIWNARNRRLRNFSYFGKARGCPHQRALGAFPGHRFFFFKEAKGGSEDESQSLVVTDVWGGRLQELDQDDWDPSATAVEETTLLIGEDPMYVLSADGAGGKIQIPKASLIKPR